MRDTEFPLQRPCRKCQEYRTELGKLRLELEEALGTVAYEKGQAAYWKAMAEKGDPHYFQEIDEWRKANPVKPIEVIVDKSRPRADG